MQLVAYPLAVPRRPARQRTRLDPLRTDFTLGTCSPASFRGDRALRSTISWFGTKAAVTRCVFSSFCFVSQALLMNDGVLTKLPKV